MGREWKKRWKELTGVQAVVGNEVVNLGLAAAAPAVAYNTAMADPFGVAQYVVNRTAKIDAMSVNVTPTLTAGSGSVTVRLNVDGVEIGSGTIAAGARHTDLVWQTELDNELVLSSGSVITLDSTKGATPTNVAVSARVMLRLFE